MWQRMSATQVVSPQKTRVWEGSRYRTSVSDICQILMTVLAVAVLSAAECLAADDKRISPQNLVEGSLQKTIDRIVSKQPGATIILSPGEYRLDKTLKLTAKHNGMTLRGSPGTVIRGSISLHDWKPVAGHDGLWLATLPMPVPAHLNPRLIFHDGKLLARARTPDAGWLETEQTLQTNGSIQLEIPQEHWNSAWDNQSGLVIRAVQKWAGFEQVVTGIDTKQRTLTLPLAAISHRQEKKNRFWFENTLGDINREGEWIYRPAENAILWKPLSQPDSSSAIPPVDVSLLDALVIVDHAENVTLEGLDFRECGSAFSVQGEIDVQAAAKRRGAIQFRWARQCTLKDSSVSLVAGYGIDLQTGSNSIRIENCRLHDLGAGGIRIGETVIAPEPEKQVSRNTVSGCQISRYGNIDFGAVGVIVFQSSESRISDNTIFDAPYSGISVGWTWGYKESPCHHNIVEHNHIHHLGSELLSDMGGVYLLGPQPGTIVRKNLIHDLKCHEYGAWGLYTDEGSTGILLEENVVARCMKAGFHQHYGKDNIIRRNLIVDCGEGGVRRSREEDHNSFTFEQNVVVNTTGHFLHSNWKNRNVKLNKNLYFSNAPQPWRWGMWKWNEWQELGYDKDSLLADPLLVDRSQPQNGFQINSPVYRELGWWSDRSQPRPLADVGPRHVFVVPASE